MTDRMVGGSPARVGGLERVTGRQAYVADIRLEDALQVKLVTLDVARARIVSIDTSAALAVPGVRLVDHRGRPAPADAAVRPQFQDRPVLAVGETQVPRRAGGRVAAETRDAAEEAAGLVRVEYEELPAVFTVAGALDPAAPLVQDPALRPSDPLRRDERPARAPLRLGRRRRARAPTSSSRTPTRSRWSPTSRSSRTRSSPRPTATASPSGATIQHPYLLQRVIARLLDLPLSKVRVVAPDPGGGFGGKQHAKSSRSSRSWRFGPAGRSASFCRSRRRSRRSAARRAEVRVRTGFDATARWSSTTSQPTTSSAPTPTLPTGSSEGELRRCRALPDPDVRESSPGACCRTRPPAPPSAGSGVPRRPGRWSPRWTSRHGLGIDPLEMRLRNLVRKGESFVPGDTPADGDGQETLRKAAELIGWGTPVAPAAARVSRSPSSPGRRPASRSPWSGCSPTAARSSTPAPRTWVRVPGRCRPDRRRRARQPRSIRSGWSVGDTAIVPFDLQTSASRSTVYMGNAVLLEACRDIRRVECWPLTLSRPVSTRMSCPRDRGVWYSRRGSRRSEAPGSRARPLGGEFIGHGTTRRRRSRRTPARR